MAVTILDIARKLKLSHTTVSRALNNRQDINIPDATRRRVIEAAKEMGYRPNRSAQALISGKTRNIALLAEDIRERTGPHFSRMLVGVEAKARCLGYRVLVCGELASILEERFVDGVVMISEPDDPRLGDLARTTKCVFVCYRPDIFPNWVSWNDEDGAYSAVRYLLELGHRDIAGLFGNILRERDTSYPKVLGFRKAVREVEANAFEFWGELSPDQFENGYALAKELLKKREGITAVFARNDLIALGAMKAVREVGLSIPGDISFVGYNDTTYARCSDPGLTSVHTPIEEVGELAVAQLVRMIEEGGDDFEGAMMPTSITVRQSCASPRA